MSACSQPCSAIAARQASANRARWLLSIPQLR